MKTPQAGMVEAHSFRRIVRATKTVESLYNRGGGNRGMSDIGYRHPFQAMLDPDTGVRIIVGYLRGTEFDAEGDFITVMHQGSPYKIDKSTEEEIITFGAPGLWVVYEIVESSGSFTATLKTVLSLDTTIHIPVGYIDWVEGGYRWYQILRTHPVFEWQPAGGFVWVELWKISYGTPLIGPFTGHVWEQGYLDDDGNAKDATFEYFSPIFAPKRTIHTPVKAGVLYPATKADDHYEIHVDGVPITRVVWALVTSSGTGVGPHTVSIWNQGYYGRSADLTGQTAYAPGFSAVTTLKTELPYLAMFTGSHYELLPEVTR